MATLPSAKTWSTGETVTAVNLNDNIRDGFGWFFNPPRCLVWNNADQSVNGTTGSKLLQWNQSAVDSDGMFSSSTPSRITAQTAGVYEIILHMRWTATSDSSPGVRSATINLNNNGAVASSGSGLRLGEDSQMMTLDTTCPNTCHLHLHWFLDIDDYIEGTFTTTLSTGSSTIPGGSSSAIDTFFAARWVGEGPT